MNRRILVPVCALLAYSILRASALGVWDEPLSTTAPSYPSRGHQLQPTAFWGQLTPPYPTNVWWNNLVLGGGSNPVYPLPYMLSATGSGLGVSNPGRTAANTYIFYSFLNNLNLGCTEGFNRRYLTAFDDVMATMQWQSGNGGTLTCPMVRGASCQTGIYANITPQLRTIHVVLSVNGQGGSGTATGTRFEVRLNNGQRWIVYASKSISFNFNSNSLTATAPFSGFLKLCWIASDSVVTHFDRAANTYPTGGDVSYTVAGDVAVMTFQWKTVGDADDLLLFAKVHHMDTMLDPSIAIPAGSYNSMRGQLTGVFGGAWRIAERLTPIEWYAPSPIDPTYEAAVRAALRSDTNGFGIGAGDPYFFGKGLSRIARQALIADQLGETTIATRAREYLKTRLSEWFAGTNWNPLRYDNTWKGVCTDGAMNNAAADFGMGWYNDHHFHFGYFVYAAAVIAKGDRAWFTTERTNKIMDLVRDYANPSAKDPYYPVTRCKDWYDGNAWASGLVDFADGKNQESTSESVNGFYGVYLLGLGLGNQQLADYGRLLLATEIRAARKYWQITSVSSVYEAGFSATKVVGILWSNKVDYATWFGSNAEFIHCIQMLPFTPITEELLPSSWIREDYPILERAINSASTGWRGFIFLSRAVIDKGAAWGQVMSLNAYDDGNSQSNSMYWVATRPTPGSEAGLSIGTEKGTWNPSITAAAASTATTRATSGSTRATTSATSTGRATVSGSTTGSRASTTRAASRLVTSTSKATTRASWVTTTSSHMTSTSERATSRAMRSTSRSASTASRSTSTSARAAATMSTGTTTGGWPVVQGPIRAKINFQPESGGTPWDWVADTGAAFGSRKGLHYGWDSTNANAYRRNDQSSPNWSVLYDTLVAMQVGGTYTWNLAVPQGDYNVIMAVGDPSNFDCHSLLLEGRHIINQCTDSGAHYLRYTGTHSVSDGALTLANGPGTSNNKICYIEVYTSTGTLGTVVLRVNKKRDAVAEDISARIADTMSRLTGEPAERFHVRPEPFGDYSDSEVLRQAGGQTVEVLIKDNGFYGYKTSAQTVGSNLQNAFTPAEWASAGLPEFGGFQVVEAPPAPVPAAGSSFPTLEVVLGTVFGAAFIAAIVAAAVLLYKRQQKRKDEDDAEPERTPSAMELLYGLPPRAPSSGVLIATAAPASSPVPSATALAQSPAESVAPARPSSPGSPQESPGPILSRGRLQDRTLQKSPYRWDPSSSPSHSQHTSPVPRRFVPVESSPVGGQSPMLSRKSPVPLAFQSSPLVPRLSPGIPIASYQSSPLSGRKGPALNPIFTPMSHQSVRMQALPEADVEVEAEAVPQDLPEEPAVGSPTEGHAQ